MEIVKAINILLNYDDDFNPSDFFVKNLKFYKDKLLRKYNN